MTDQYLDEEEEEQEERTVTLKRSQIRELEANAKAGRKAQERLAELERESAFMKAGIDLSDKRATYFQAGYAGELNPEAIKAEWDENFGQSSSEADPQEAAAHKRVAEASSGAEPPKSNLTLDDIARAESPEDVLRMSAELGLLPVRE